MFILIFSLIIQSLPAFAGDLESASPPVRCIEEVAPAGRESMVEAIYDASSKYEVPPQILYGALMQETGLSPYGISKDFGNYSCGVSQFNIVDWCRYLQSLAPAEQARFQWPSGLTCDDSRLVYPAMLEVFLREISRNEGAAPMTGYKAASFSRVFFSQMGSAYPGKTDLEKRAMYEAVQSFAQHCEEVAPAIHLMAFTLKNTFDRVIPPVLKNTQKYAAGETFTRSCKHPYPSPYYPLHVGWVLTDAIYNFGEDLVDLINHDSPVTERLSLAELQKRIAWSGVYGRNDGLIHFKENDGSDAQVSWFRTCVNQNHVSKIVDFTLSSSHSGLTSIWNGCERGLRASNHLPFVPANRRQK